MERKVITGAGKPGAEPNMQNHSKHDTKGYAPLRQVFALKTAASSRGLPEHSTNSPQPQQNLLGLQLRLESLSQQIKGPQRVYG